jgi:hypothetical protein
LTDVKEVITVPGPNSTPNGDTTLSRGHVDEKFVCNIHAEKQLDKCEENIRRRENADSDREKRQIPACQIVPLREYLAVRGRLRTGKTK